MASCALCTVTAHFYFWQVFLLPNGPGPQHLASPLTLITLHYTLCVRNLAEPSMESVTEL